MTKSTDTVVKFSIYLPEALWQRLDLRASKERREGDRGASKTAIVVRALDQYLSQKA